MLIKDAIDMMGRSRHVNIVVGCLKHEDGLTYKELYIEYCKICKEKDIIPLVFSSMYGVIRLAVARGVVRRERIVVSGKKGSATRVWMVR